ncbi:hypothetical protein SLE2022_392920 [Rubroshorea leprosula]
MATKIRRIYKRFKYICQIFVVKEREMEIGYPTDVKHVAHIGWDGASGTPPSWMSEFKPGPDFNTSLGANPRDSNSEATNPLSPQDYAWPEGSQKWTSLMEKSIPYVIRENYSSLREHPHG